MSFYRRGVVRAGGGVDKPRVAWAACRRAWSATCRAREARARRLRGEGRMRRWASGVQGSKGVRVEESHACWRWGTAWACSGMAWAAHGVHQHDARTAGSGSCGLR